MQSTPNSVRTEATSFENDARFDLHKASEQITSAKEFYQNQEIDAKTREAMGIAAQNGYTEYVAEGITEIEQYLQQYAYAHGVGERMEFWRKSENA